METEIYGYGLFIGAVVLGYFIGNFIGKKENVRLQ